MTVATVEQINELRVLTAVREAIESNGDEQTASRIDDLIHQANESTGRIQVAFCGLFSAGKSSLLNTLCQSHQLATGAVPTTAVISQVELPGTDGHVILMDTPGVDSTDDAHREETESALHLADVIALVMDYQHVEAEENLELARTFSDQGKRLILIVNQIDKHFDWELSFEEFDARVQSVFTDYDIHHEALFYTSSESSPHNQVQALAEWLRNLASSSDDVRVESLHRRLRELVQEHVKRLFDERRQSLDEKLLEQLGAVPFDDSEAREWLNERQMELAKLEEEREAAISALLDSQRTAREEFVRIVELAQISPYETTERGRHYVESLRPDFKVGWFRSKQKTESEQRSRLENFTTDLVTRAEQFLLWPLKNRLRGFIQETPWADKDWMGQVDNIRCEISSEFLQSAVKPGALVSSQYPYQYVKDVVASIKRMVLADLTNLVDAWFPSAVHTLKQNQQDLESKIEQLSGRVTLLKSWLELRADQECEVKRLLSLGGGQV